MSEDRITAFSNSFTDEVEAFAASLEVPFERTGDSLIFRGYGLVLRLVPLSFFASGDPLSGAELLRNEDYGNFQVIRLYEDYWRRSNTAARLRVAAHLGHFRSLFARKCKVERCDSVTASDFLRQWHSYGAASAKYHYVLRCGDEIVAAASFSSPRSIPRRLAGPDGNDVEIVCRSYEWVRYASLPDVRISGGMGKMFKAFVREVQPDDVMSYADLEWSDGEVYRRLGFECIGERGPVTFVVDPADFTRVPLRYADPEILLPGHCPAPALISNFGSGKYLWVNKGKLFASGF